ncbi:MAG TPA: hypothetical protein VKV03_09340 [Candidatus Binataceae bacterium]|nr:hypothetical protein [Candidatus Binataceae bacterium]
MRAKARRFQEFAPLDALADGPRKRGRVAGRNHKSDFRLRSDARDFRVLFHHRDKRLTGGEDCINLARHHTSGDAGAERDQMEIAVGEPFAQLGCLNPIGESNVAELQMFRARLEMNLARAVSGNDESHTPIVAHEMSRIQHAFEVLRPTDISRIHR